MKMTVLWLPCAPECLMRLPSSAALCDSAMFLMWLTLPFLCYLLLYFSNILLLLLMSSCERILKACFLCLLSHYFRILRQSLDFAVTPGDQPVSLCLLFALHVILRTRIFF